MAIHAFQRSETHVENLVAARVGCVVMLQDVDTREVETYELVPDWKSNPIQGRLSVDSPLGRELLGKQEGEFVKVFASSRARKFALLDIETTR